MAKLQPVIVTHPSFTYYSGDRYFATVDKEVVPWLYRLRTMVNQELIVAGASDSPIVPNNPLMGIYGAVSRRTTSGAILNLNENLTAAEALKLYTLNAAYASHEEHIKGSITPGKLADLVLLTADPTKVEVERIPDIKVEMTVIGGKVAWES
jgi:predicted amidohydrolase YtcJ